jgi:hypothetical protein
MNLSQVSRDSKQSVQAHGELLHVVCYNLNQYMQYPDAAKRILALLQMLVTDVIILSEVMRWQDVEHIATMLGLHCHPGAWCAGGHTIVTRRPIVATHVALIPNSTWQNGVTGVCIDSGVWIFSTHLDDLKYKRDETKRLLETRYILSHLPPFDRAILGGDFNSPSHLDYQPNTHAHATLLPSHLLQATGWQDVQAGQSWTRGTWIPSKSQVPSRIDRIYTLGSIVPVQGSIIDRYDLGLKRWPTGPDHRVLWQQFMIV